MIRILSICLTFLFITSCASNRINQTPNLNLTGDAADQEYKNFKLEYLSIFNGKFTSEGALTVFDTDRMSKLIQDISPKTEEVLESTRTREYIGSSLLVALIATLFIKDEDGGISPAYWWVLGGSTIYSAYMWNVREKTADQFNKDLKVKFTPRIGYTFNF